MHGATHSVTVHYVHCIITATMILFIKLVAHGLDLLE